MAEGAALAALLAVVICGAAVLITRQLTRRADLEDEVTYVNRILARVQREIIQRADDPLAQLIQAIFDEERNRRLHRTGLP